MKGIYKWTNLINNKVYIGKSVNIPKRLREYKYEVEKNNQRPIIRALQKYGFQNFKFEIIENCDYLSDEKLLEREQYWMNYYNSQNPQFGYNILNAIESPAEHFSVGSSNTKARLNEDKVLSIRDAIYNMCISPAEVYKMYSNQISYNAFEKAYRGTTWNNVDTSMIRDRNKEVVRKNQPKAKLTVEDVRTIRYRYEVLKEDISTIYESYLGICNRNTIKRVCNYETWKNIT